MTLWVLAWPKTGGLAHRVLAWPDPTGLAKEGKNLLIFFKYNREKKKLIVE